MYHYILTNVHNCTSDLTTLGRKLMYHSILNYALRLI